MPFRPGDKVENYEVLAMIGRGAHGVVLKVRSRAIPAAVLDQASETAVVDGSPRPPSTSYWVHALKVLPCDGFPFGGGSSASSASSSTQDAKEAAFAEARLLRRLRHPHIVVCEDVFWDSERHAVALVLEFMDGGDLQGLLEARRTEVRQHGGQPCDAHFARRVLAAVGGALAYVHARGVLHRDVKPGNVLLTRHSQRIKLADFGIAKILERTQGANTVVGTPYYLSPEIVMGQAYGQASDCWALGVLLFEVAALARPFEAGNQLALVRRICEDPAPELPNHVETDVRLVVEGLLRKHPTQRLPLRDALRASEAIAALVVGADDTSPIGIVAVASAIARSAGGGAANLGADPDAAGVGALSSTAQGGIALDSRAAAPAPQAPQAESADEDGDEALVAEVLRSSPSSPCSQASTPSADDDRGTWGELQGSWCGSEAAAAAREALGGDVDDPEELVRALAALERERSVERNSTVSAELATTEAPMSPGAFRSLESELRIRIAALRVDAAAMLNDLEATEAAQQSDDQSDGDDSDRDSVSAVNLGSARLSNVVGSAQALEQALEVATSLGVNTDQSEERIAKKCRMLSLRVKWGGIARFCMLPVTVTFESLVAEVSRRFGLERGAALPQLRWREAEDLFSLRSQSDWEECLQRRGLVAQPGRLELIVDGSVPPPQPTQPRVRVYGGGTVTSGFGYAGHSPMAHQRPELFTWRCSPGLWAARRGASRTRAGARSPPTTGAAFSSLARSQPASQEVEEADGAALSLTKARKREQDVLKRTAQETMLNTSSSGTALAALAAAAAYGPGGAAAYGPGGAAARPRSSAMLAQPSRATRSIPTGDARGLAGGSAAASQVTTSALGELVPGAGVRESSLGSAVGKARSRPLVQRGRTATGSADRGDPAVTAAPSRTGGKVNGVERGEPPPQPPQQQPREREKEPPSSFHGALTGLDAMMQVNGRSVPLQ